MLTTSYRNENYYIFDTSNQANIFLMVVYLSDNNYNNLANMLLANIITFKEIEQKLFIPKTSELGLAINTLITKKEIQNQKENLTEEINFKSLKYAIQNEQYNKYISITTELIKNNEKGSVSKLSTRYDVETLRQIIKIGNLQKYLELDTTGLTGFEEEGIIFNKDQQLCEFDINTKELKELSTLEEYKAQKKLKKLQKNN